MPDHAPNLVCLERNKQDGKRSRWRPAGAQLRGPASAVREKLGGVQEALGWKNQSLLNGGQGVHVVSVAVAVPAAAAAMGHENCRSAVERGGYHAASTEHLPGPLRRVHHTAEPPGVRSNPKSGKTGVLGRGFGKSGREANLQAAGLRFPRTVPPVEGDV